MRTKIMKTKNILRTLLMAVTLLLGAEQAQAQQLWAGSSQQGTNIASRDAFLNAKAGDIVRVHVTPQWNISFYNFANGGVKMSNSDGNGYISSASVNVTNGYIESGFTEEGLAVINDQWNGGFRINQNPQNLNINQITLVDADGNETKLSDGTTNSQLDISKDKMSSVTASHKVRIYVSHIWKLSLKTNSWGAVPFEGSDNGETSNASKNITNGYIDCVLSSASLSENAILSQYNGGLTIVPEKLTMTKVELVSGGTTPVNPPVGPTTYTITYMVNGAVYTTQNYAAGASISLPAQPTMEGFSFVGWDGMPTNLIMPDQSITVTAMWSAASYDVSASYNSQFGAVSINNTGNDFTTAQAGSTVYVTCTPYSGYYVQSVSLNTGGTVSGSDNSYSFTMPTQAVTVYVTFVAGTVNAPITSTTQLATFSSTYALDFSDVTALKAYIVTGTNNGYAILERVTSTVAPNTGLIIYGATADIPIALSGDTKSSNKLIATTTDTNVSGSGNYVLSVKSGDAVFAETSTTSANVPANHAYLHLGGASARRFITIKVSNETTGINSIEAEGNAIEQTFYNLNGQRVETPTRGGIYIVNGKKVLMK